MKILNGKVVSESLRAVIRQKGEEFQSLYNKAPGLSVILVGDDPASQVYVRNKEMACQTVGFHSTVIKMPASTTMKDLKSKIQQLNEDTHVHGLLVQLPLPKGLDENEVLSWISPLKDVDALTIENIGLFMAGRPRVVSCTPNGVMEILKFYKIPIAGRRAVVVGRSQIVGIPMARLLQDANATVTVCHSKTPHLKEHTQEADIVVVAAGNPKMLGREDFKEGSVVVDVGIHRIKKSNGQSVLCGDVRFDELEGRVMAATPVPGGVGPMTITMLLENTLKLAKLQEGIHS
ncbi:MAG: bifunctional methylenetetrahydrofolate dehydrogenase/methenyltetrahydrofolate cyclohydrolase FolD [Bdellovibrionales bacterium]|nr:bifunctional methylenetetrahydrofolate dehydrogenase/methenyltetrahydrofolate cyclohydrolase FolD [Bdellovibrionales bacterium]